MMNRTIYTTALVVTFLIAAGCQKGQKQQQIAEVPPPPATPVGPSAAYEPQPFGPIQVEPAPLPSQSAQPQPLPPQAFEPVPTQPAPGAAGASDGGLMPGNGTYTIQKGDTLWSIAETYYGSGQRWVDIVDANPGLNPQKLPVGKTITMP